MSCKIVAGILLLVSDLALANEEHLVGRFTAHVPYGTSIVYYDFDEAVVINPIRVLYALDRGCPLLPNTEIAVRYEGSSAWHPTTVSVGGYYSHGNDKINSIRFLMQQYGYQYEDCNVSIFEKAPVPDAEVYAGFLGYIGGYSRQQAVEFTESMRTKKVKLDVPDFCHGVEVLEVRLKMVAPERDVVLSKSRLESNVFELPEARDLTKVFVTLNGPKEACDIPVYAYQKAP